MHEHFEHKADMGVRGTGKSVEEAFEECAKAMYEVMVETDKVKHEIEVEFEVRAQDRETLLVEWLNKLLLEGDVRGLFFSKFKVVGIRKEGEELALKGAAWGEKQDEAAHGAKTEVKAATYSGLKVTMEHGKWIAQCIVDV